MIESFVVDGFTPVSALLGGLLIGGAAALLLLGLGRVAGISGIAAGLAEGPAAERGWRACFLVGLPLGALLVALLRGGLTVEVAASPPLLVLAGLLVGFGTRLGSGCTSGHGVCGLARGSQRSLAATAVFMATGAITVWLLRQAQLLGGA